MGYERPGLEYGHYCADIDMSNLVLANGAVYRFRPVWLGPAVNIVGHGQGGAALLAKGSRTDAPLGILQNNPVQNESGLVIWNGITKVYAASTWVVGDYLTWNSSGLIVKATSGTYAIAKAVESASIGDISSAALYPSLGAVP